MCFICVADVGALAQYECVRKDTWALASVLAKSCRLFQTTVDVVAQVSCTVAGTVLVMTHKAGTCITDTMVE